MNLTEQICREICKDKGLDPDKICSSISIENQTVYTSYQWASFVPEVTRAIYMFVDWAVQEGDLCAEYDITQRLSEQGGSDE